MLSDKSDCNINFEGTVRPLNWHSHRIIEEMVTLKHMVDLLPKLLITLLRLYVFLHRCQAQLSAGVDHGGPIKICAVHPFTLPTTLAYGVYGTGWAGVVESSRERFLAHKFVCEKQTDKTSLNHCKQDSLLDQMCKV